MRRLSPVMSLLVLLLSTTIARAAPDPAERCKRDADCVFSFRSPCFCPPCGEAPRTAITRSLHQRYERGWAVKVPHCGPCKQCKPPTRWSGAKAVCQKGRCTVAGRRPRPLRSVVNVAINRVVYRLEVEYRDGGFQPVRMPRMPRHHSSSFSWMGLKPFSLARRPGQRYLFDFVVMHRVIQKVPDRRRWRATYHSRVDAVEPRPPKLEYSGDRICKLDSDCVFRPDKPCPPCPPCGTSWRQVLNKVTLKRLQQRWAEGLCNRPKCPACERTVLGTKTVCIKGQCSVR
jgi:hypothetical protein